MKQFKSLMVLVLLSVGMMFSASALPFISLNLQATNINSVPTQYDQVGQSLSLGWEQPFTNMFSMTGEIGVLSGGDYVGGDLGVYSQKAQFHLSTMPMALIGAKVHLGNVINLFFKAGVAQENVAYSGDNTGDNTFAKTAGIINAGIEVQYNPHVLFALSYFQTLAGKGQTYTYDDLANAVTVTNAPSAVSYTHLRAHET